MWRRRRAKRGFGLRVQHRCCRPAGWATAGRPCCDGSGLRAEAPFGREQQGQHRGDTAADGRPQNQRVLVDPLRVDAQAGGQADAIAAGHQHDGGQIVVAPGLVGAGGPAGIGVVAGQAVVVTLQPFEGREETTQIGNGPLGLEIKSLSVNKRPRPRSVEELPSGAACDATSLKHFEVHGKAGRPSSLRKVLCLSRASLMVCARVTSSVLINCKSTSASPTAVLI